MTTAQDPDTEELLDRADKGDATALSQLMLRHRGRVKKMVAVRLDRRSGCATGPV